MSINSDEDDCEVRPSYPFSPWGFAYEVITFAAVVAGSFSTFLSRVGADFASHNNAAIDRRREQQGRRLLMDDLESFEKGERP